MLKHIQTYSTYRSFMTKIKNKSDENSQGTFQGQNSSPTEFFLHNLSVLLQVFAQTQDSQNLVYSRAAHYHHIYYNIHVSKYVKYIHTESSQREGKAWFCMLNSSMVQEI